jgi:DNA oxidative demethylase
MPNNHDLRQSGQLFEDPPEYRSERLEPLAEGATLLRGFATAEAAILAETIQEILSIVPLRHMVTPGGYRMSVAMTNCGDVGWVSDRSGYRYDAADATTGRPWPPIPPSFLQIATSAAAEAGFRGFEPDACVINRYEPGARLTLHQDKDERDFSAPIVRYRLACQPYFCSAALAETTGPSVLG